MKKLAIKGHLTQGKKVIETLEIFGGINSKRLEGTDHNSYYTIENNGTISGFTESYLRKCNNHVLYTIEEFFEGYPHKVGDKVQYKGYKGATSCGIVYEIERMKWEDNQVKYIICDLYWKNIKCTATTEDLRPYKEEIMGDNIIDTVKESEGRYRIVLNHQFNIEVDEGEYYAVRRKPTYPQTYEECCKVLGYEPDEDKINCYQGQLIESFVKLLICRDAYWRIAGEQMDWGKPWEPDSKNKAYCIFYCISNNTIKLSEGNLYSNVVLTFPTKEMRDDFYENFKDLIIECKELL